MEPAVTRRLRLYLARERGADPTAVLTATRPRVAACANVDM